MSWWTIFKVFIKTQMFYLNSKVYILMKNNLIWQIFLINSCQLSPSKQIMQMLKLQPFIFPCYAVVPHLFIAFVFPLSNIVGIGIHRLLVESLTMQTSFIKKNSMAITTHWLSTFFPRMLQISDADINIAFNLEEQGILCCTFLGSKLLLHELSQIIPRIILGF